MEGMGSLRSAMAPMDVVALQHLEERCNTAQQDELFQPPKQLFLTGDQAITANRLLEEDSSRVTREVAPVTRARSRSAKVIWPRAPSVHTNSPLSSMTTAGKGTTSAFDSLHHARSGASRRRSPRLVRRLSKPCESLNQTWSLGPRPFGPGHRELSPALARCLRAAIYITSSTGEP